jgi:hypothetical protein
LRPLGVQNILDYMKPDELKATIRVKTLEFEAALEAGIPHSKLMELYKELKELKYQLVQAELSLAMAKESA